MPPPRGNREKWEAFWRRPAAEAEATHRLAAALVLNALQAEGWERPRVLDLGCGAGRVVELLSAAGCRVVGADLALAALQAARQRLGPAAALAQADAFRLGLAGASFEAVVSLGYASVGSYPGVQAELARVLRPGGLALVDYRRVGLYHLPTLPLRGRHWLSAWRRGAVSLPLAGLRPGPEWAAAGFRLEAVSPFNAFPPLTGLLSVETCLRVDRLPGPLRPLLARTALARYRRH
jgi:SAM-dependent methyltransferase